MTISVLQEIAGNNTTASATTAANTFSVPCTPGSSIEVYVGSGANGTQPTGVADPTNGAYTPKTHATDGFDPSTLGIWIFQNNTANTALTVTATWAAAQPNRGLWLKEITGAANPTPYQVDASLYNPTPGTGAGAITTGSITPLSQPCLLSAVSWFPGGGAAYTANSGVQGLQGWKFNGAGSANAVSSSQRLTSTAVTAATFTDAVGGATGHYLVSGIIWTEATSTPSTPTGAIMSDMNLLLTPLALFDGLATCVNIAATSSTSANVALTTPVSNAAGGMNQVQVYNAGTTTVFVAFAATSTKAVATQTASYPVPAGFIVTLTPPAGSAFAAAVSAAAAGPVYFTSANGR